MWYKRFELLFSDVVAPVYARENGGGMAFWMHFARKMRTFLFGIFIFMGFNSAHGIIHYVSLSGTNNPPYTNWAGAATNIQWAVNSATTGDTVLVSNGIYYLTNQIIISTVITTKSVNGWAVTVVDGNNYPDKPVTNRCFYITAAATLDGFTVRNGYAADNAAGGGGVYLSAEAYVQNCKITHNITSNATSLFYGGGVFLTIGATLRNSLVCYNYSNYKGGGVSLYSSYGNIQNCTIVSNKSTEGGGIHGAAKYPYTSRVENVVCYFNTGGTTSNFIPASGTGWLYIVNSCIAPASSFPIVGMFGYSYTNNIESDPQIVNKDIGDFRLSAGSPCINSGLNQSWMSGAVDPDGRSRIDRFSRVVDMGCYEYLPQGFMFSVP